MSNDIKRLLRLSSKNADGDAVNEAWIEKEASQYSVKYRAPNGSPKEDPKGDLKESQKYNSLNEALEDPKLNQRWTGLQIDTSLKLFEVRDKILTSWGDWGKIEGGKVEENQPLDAIVVVNDKTYHRVINPRNHPTKELFDVSPDDNLQDSDCQLVKSLFAIEKNTKEYQRLKKQLVDAFKAKGYISYIGDSRDFGGLNCSGMSLIYKVPFDKRGNLESFRGKTIRICCVGSGYRAQRNFLAGPVTESVTKSASAIRETPEKKTNLNYKGFLAPLKLIKDFPLELQLILENRATEKLKRFVNSHTLSENAIASIESSGYLVKIAAEGDIQLLKHLKALGVSMAAEKDTPQFGTGSTKGDYWHSLLQAIHENCPSKTEAIIGLYSRKEFKSLFKDEYINSQMPGIKSILLTQRHKRLKKDIESQSQFETLEI